MSYFWCKYNTMKYIYYFKSIYYMFDYKNELLKFSVTILVLLIIVLSIFFAYKFLIKGGYISIKSKKMELTFNGKKIKWFYFPKTSTIGEPIQPLGFSIFRIWAKVGAISVIK